MRLSMGLLAGQPFASTLIGDASLMRRPMERVAGPLRQMGAQITTHEGRPPVRLHGGRVTERHRLRDAHGQRAGEVRHPAGRAVRERDAPGSRSPRRRAITPSACCAPSACGWSGRAQRSSLAGGQPLTGTDIEVPADFSSAAFFLVAGVLAAHAGPAAAQCGRQSDPHRPADNAAADGRADHGAPAWRRGR